MNIERAHNCRRRRYLRRRRVDNLDERPSASVCVHQLGEKLGRQVEIDAAWTAGNGGADRPRHADTDVRGMQYAKGRLAERFGDGQLVHLFVIALLKVDDFALRRAADQDHRKAVGRSVGQRRQTVEKSRSRHREADARLFRQEARDRGCVAGVLLVPERDDPDAGGLRHTAEVGDRNARNAIDRVDAVKLERIDDEVEAVGQRPVRLRRIRAFAFLLNRRAGHAILQVTQYPRGLLVVHYSTIRHVQNSRAATRRGCDRYHSRKICWARPELFFFTAFAS
jgi:hypothetical protein